MEFRWEVLLLKPVHSILRTIAFSRISRFTVTWWPSTSSLSLYISSVNRIRQITPTLCAMMGVRPPQLSQALPLPVAAEIVRLCESRPIQRALIYCPDALGKHLWNGYSNEWQSTLRHTPLIEELRAEFPSVTPVCFASMFTGAGPQDHGITSYAKPILQCDTLFDALIRANKRVAIVAVKGSSIDTIFRNRDVDYFSEEYDQQVAGRSEQLIRDDRHDVILAYVQEYDDALHRTTPESPEAIQAMRNNLAIFDRLARTFTSVWNRSDRAILFCPDHGGHISPDGRGTHGSDQDSDMEVLHLFGACPRRSAPETR